MRTTVEADGHLLVRGGTLIDGTGSPGRRADVRVRDGLVCEVGPGLSPDGERILDVSQSLVCPGFIDSHTHFDFSLFWDPWCDSMPQHGVTSVLIGNCSLSLAPTRPDLRGDLASIFCYVEDLPRDVVDLAVPWDWRYFGEFLDRLGDGGLGVNVAGLVGHTALRLFVMGAEAWERAATPQERSELAELLRRCLREGAFGLSTSYFDEDPDKRPVPSVVADDAERLALLEVLAAGDAMLEFIPHQSMRAMEEDLEAVVALLRQWPVRTSWLGLFYSEKVEARIMAVLDRQLELQQSGLAIYPQISPRTIDYRINFFGGMSFMDLSEGWHRAIQEPDAATKRTLLTDPAWREVAREEWDRVRRTLFPHRRPQQVKLISVTRPELQPWVGKTLADVIAARGGHPSDVLADWVVENDLTPGVVGVGVSNADPEGVAAMLTHPAAVVSNSDAGAHLQMLCGVGDATLLLTRHVRDRGDLTLEAAVHGLTGRQAEVFGLTGRVLRPGQPGDLVVFRLEELTWDPEELVADLPGGGVRLRRPPGGYRATVVAGTVVQEHGRLTGARPGRVLRHTDGRRAHLAPQGLP